MSAMPRKATTTGPRRASGQPSVRSARSPLAEAVARIGDRWSLLVVEALLAGPRRFKELTAAIEGIAPNILSARLRHLEREGLLRSTPYSRRPVRLAYELTASGRELAGALRLLAHWATRSTDAEPPSHAACGTPLETRWWCPTCARVVESPDDDELRYV
jgi:DNA-binding HxlR family transcriptional regulator